MRATSRTAMPEIFRHCPEVRERLPWVPLARATPVERLGRLESFLHAGPVWVKRDDRASSVHPGGMARELEFLFGDLVRRGVHRVLAFGAADSEDCLAITSFARLFDVQPVLALSRPSSPERALSVLEMEQALGAELHRVDGGPRALLRLVRSCLGRRDADGRRWPAIAWPRQLAIFGALGYVNAAFELKRQINCGILPAPARIYVPAQSGAAAAGLLLGCQMAEIETTIVIAARAAASAPRPERIAAAAFAFLARRSRLVGSKPLRNGALEVRIQAPARGRGTPAHTPVALLRDLEAIDLDPLVAAPAMAALIEDQRAGAVRAPVLFWHTRPARRLVDRPVRPPAGLPHEFLTYFVSP